MLIKTISTPALRSLSSKVAIVPAKPLVEAELISGVPPEITRRPVRIYKPTKTAMQSGTAETMYWRLDFDAQQQWSNPLMGWASTYRLLTQRRPRALAAHQILRKETGDCVC